jgi:hypothetical protein
MTPKLLLLTLIAALIAVPPPVGVGYDFGFFHAAGRAVVGMSNPYTTVSGFYTPPWILPALAPLGLLTVEFAWRVYLVAAILGYFLAFYRMGFRPWELGLLMLSPWTLLGLHTGNIDWLVLLGATLPPALGLWFLALKPQLSLVLIALWSLRAVKAGWRAYAYQVAPLVAAMLAGLFFHWSQPVHLARMTGSWNGSLWPWGIPVGLALAWLAWRHPGSTTENNVADRSALAAGPFLTPYLSWFSWVATLAGTRGRWLVAGWVVSWGVVVVKATL